MTTIAGHAAIDPLNELLDAAIEVTEADWADIRLVDAASGRLRLAAHRNCPPGWEEFWGPGVKGLCLEALQRRARVVVEDIAHSELMAGMASSATLARLGVRGLQSTPLLARSGAAIGTFSTQLRRPFRPDARMLRLLDLLAQQAADRIERSRAEAELAASEGRRRFLAELEDALRPLADPAEVEFEACRRLAGRLDAARAYFLHVDEDAGVLRVARGFTRAGVTSIAGVHRAADHEWALSILRRGECVVVPDFRSAASISPAARGVLSAMDTMAVISVPLVKKRRLVGALNLSDGRPRDWSATDIALVRDVGERIWAASERAIAEAARREGAALFEGIFENAPIGIGIVRRDGRFENANSVFLALVGYELAELRTLGPHALVHPADRDANAAEIARMWDGKAPRVQIDIRYLRKSGEPAWVRKSMATIPGRDAFVVMAVDIGAARQAEEARARTRQLEALGQLSGGIAHDFNNLLMAISLNLEMAEENAPDAETRAGIAEAKDAVGQGAGLTRRLLSFARRRPLSPTRVVPAERMRDIAQLLRGSLGERVELGLRIEPDGWAVEADAGEIDSAAINLAANARDAMPGGGRVEVAVENVALGGQEAARADIAPGSYVRMDFADNGTGMSTEVLRRATEPFFTTKPQGEGTGLGLSGILAFARQSGGGLAIESEPGRGTRVSLLLPRAAAAAPGPADAGQGDAPAGRGERVLLVEDNEQVRRALAERLRLLGYAVVEAARGSDAIATLKNDAAIRLVLSDVVMPGGVDGFDVADWVRANRPGLGVLLASGNMARDPRRETHPDLRVLEKPYAIAELARALRSSLGKG